MKKWHEFTKSVSITNEKVMIKLSKIQMVVEEKADETTFIHLKERSIKVKDRYEDVKKLLES